MFLYHFIALAVIIMIYARYEATWLKVEHVRVFGEHGMDCENSISASMDGGSDKSAKATFDKAGKTLKVIQLSDIHIDRMYVNPHKIVDVIRQEKPDLILFTGDYVEKPADADRFLRFLDTLRGAHCSAEIWFCLGNHDQRAFLRDQDGLERFITTMRGRGLRYLNNQTVVLEKNGIPFKLTGIGDMRYGKDDVAAALDEHFAALDDHSAPKTPKSPLHIAISHNPDIVLKLPTGSVDLLLCGHFHGGQIWAPFNIEFAILRKEALCKMGITRGLHQVNGIRLYINRGIGNVIFPFRFFSRPEITVFTLPLDGSFSS